MITIQRLNLDTSWFISWHKTAFVVDPWLVGSEIDGFKWLNEQWHILEPVAPAAVPAHDYLLLTQSYSDHCHAETIQLLPQHQATFASPKAFKRLAKELPQKTVQLVSPDYKPVAMGQLQLYCLRPDRWIDPIYYAFIISAPNGEAIFYAPHGFDLDQKQLAFCSQFEFKLLITSFTAFKLPAIMGGMVNPGFSNVQQLFKQLSPKAVVNTHDEQKIAKGLVNTLAKVTYPDFSNLSLFKPVNFVHIPDYNVYTI